MWMDRDSAGFVSFVRFVFKKLMSVLVLNTDFPNIPNVDGWGFRRIRVIREIRVQFLSCGILGLNTDFPNIPNVDG